MERSKLTSLAHKISTSPDSMIMSSISLYFNMFYVFYVFTFRNYLILLSSIQLFIVVVSKTRTPIHNLKDIAFKRGITVTTIYKELYAPLEAVHVIYKANNCNRMMIMNLFVVFL